MKNYWKLATLGLALVIVLGLASIVGASPGQDTSLGNEENIPNAESTEYIEQAAIASHVHTDGLTFDLVSDNPGKRIFFLMNEAGEKQFKILFIKHTDILEIIDLQNGGQVYRGEI